MTIQQMMLGGYPVMQLSAAPADGTVFTPEPAPVSQSVFASTTVSVNGGIGPFSYSWAYVSGDAGIAPTGSTTSAYCGWSAMVSKNASRSAVWRVTVTDAVESRSVNVAVSLSYYTDL